MRDNGWWQRWQYDTDNDDINTNYTKQSNDDRMTMDNGWRMTDKTTIKQWTGEWGGGWWLQQMTNDKNNGWWQPRTTTTKEERPHWQRRKIITRNNQTVHWREGGRRMTTMTRGGVVGRGDYLSSSINIAKKWGPLLNSCRKYWIPTLNPVPAIFRAPLRPWCPLL